MAPDILLTRARLPRLGAFAAAALTVVALGAPAASHAATCTGVDTALNHSDAATLSAAAKGMECLANDARAQAGLPALSAVTGVESAARDRAGSLVAGGTTGACDRAKAAGIGWTSCWESYVNWRPTPTARFMFTTLMNDAGAKARLLRTDVTQIGAGIVDGNPVEGAAGTGATAVLVDLKPTTTTTPAPAPAPAPAPSGACNTADYDVTVDKLTQDAAEKAVVCLTNDQRKANGVAPFTANAQLGAAARGHANAGASIRWWTGGADPHHNPQTGTNPPDRIRAAGYCAGATTTTAENAFTSAGIGTFPPTPRGAVNWWMQSPGHRANILNPALHDIGAGVARGTADPTLPYTPAGTFVQDFGTC